MTGLPTYMCCSGSHSLHKVFKSSIDVLSLLCHCCKLPLLQHHHPVLTSVPLLHSIALPFVPSHHPTLFSYQLSCYLLACVLMLSPGCTYVCLLLLVYGPVNYGPLCP